MEKYIIQKAQKIVSALYLITDFIKDSDAIKWEIREEGISFVSGTVLSDANMVTLSSEKLISFLNIAILSNLISKMNANIVIHEIQSLIDFINKNNLEEQNHKGYILSDSFFATDTPAQIDKGHKEIAIKDKKNDKNERQESILDLLKKDSNLTIKDFAKVIKDCSEKTIQRELLLLVEKGVVKKVGERRWSTYSLI